MKAVSTLANSLLNNVCDCCFEGEELKIWFLILFQQTPAWCTQIKWTKRTRQPTKKSWVHKLVCERRKGRARAKGSELLQESTRVVLGCVLRWEACQHNSRKHPSHPTLPNFSQLRQRHPGLAKLVVGGGDGGGGGGRFESSTKITKLLLTLTLCLSSSYFPFQFARPHVSIGLPVYSTLCSCLFLLIQVFPFKKKTVQTCVFEFRGSCWCLYIYIWKEYKVQIYLIQKYSSYQAQSSLMSNSCIPGLGLQHLSALFFMSTGGKSGYRAAG